MKTSCRSSISPLEGGDHLHVTINRAELLAAVKRIGHRAAGLPAGCSQGCFAGGGRADGKLTVTSTNLEGLAGGKLPLHRS